MESWSSGASCPGLIEARGRSRRRSPPSWGHPGLLAPASLKPRVIHGWRRKVRRGHPGLLAPASLKHVIPSAWLSNSNGSSGASCPGLIEAGSGPSACASCVSGHPGLLAPASLKPLSCAVSHALRPDGHPGLLAPASLKRHHSRAGGRGVPESSGASCPGLIEAIRGSYWPQRDGRVIRGFLPRPH